MTVNSNNNNNNNKINDLDSLKEQILIDQEKDIEKQKQSHKINQDNIVIDDERDLKSKILNYGFADFVIKTIKKTVKREDSLIRQLFYTGLSAYSNKPINIGIKAPTSEGKTYVVKEVVMKFFPKKDVWIIGSMSPKVIIRQKGKLVDGDANELLEPKIRELKKQISSTKDAETKENLQEQLQELLDNSKMVIDLSDKIFVFLEPPHPQTWEILKAILSHDAWEIEHPFVDKTEYLGTQVKRVVTLGWSVCIFCSARDESKWEIWPEIQSRCLITSPNMSIEKYQESNLLTAQTMSLPDDIQQKVIVSDGEIELAKKCVLFLKQQILKFSRGEKEYQEQKNNHLDLDSRKKSNPVWVPYGQILGEVLPAEKGSDMRIQQRLFSLLNIIPLAKIDSRKRLFDGNQEMVIANLEDLAEVLHITQNISGIPSYKIKFYREIFLPLIRSKNKKDEKDGKEEKIIAVTTKELADYYKEKRGKAISTDNLRKTFLVELINNDYIGELKSELDSRQFIYYPLIEFEDSEIMQFNLTKEETDDRDISKISNSSRFDNYLHVSPIKIPKYCKTIPQDWLIYEILSLAKYRIDLDNFVGPLADYLNTHEKFQLKDVKGNKLKVKDFVKEYEKNLPLSRYIFKPEISNYHSNIFGDIKLLQLNQSRS
ncbi:MAG TPA: hypothetical protein VLA74_14010 [Nitrososphaeraceae archaeon]|nr:hypothetical protein [Nitrososphaeraceae archaeon]